MLSRPVYESLPYAYLFAGSAVIFLLDTPLAWLPGLLLFIAGAHVWILRAQFRSHQEPQKLPHKGHMPHPLYEAAPFIYLFAGIACLLLYLRYDGIQSLPLTLAAAAMFFGAGVGGWIMRAISRHYHDRTQQGNAPH